MPWRRRLASIGEGRTVGYAAHGAAGMLTLFIPWRAVQLDGVNWRCLRDDLYQRLGQDHGHVDADHGLLLHGLRALHRQHVPLPSGLMLGGNFTIMDYLIWNESRRRSAIWSAVWLSSA
jgi:hypothetical protein